MVVGALPDEYVERLKPLYSRSNSNADMCKHYDDISAEYEKLYEGGHAFSVCADMMLEHAPSPNGARLEPGSSTSEDDESNSPTLPGRLRVLDVACGPGLLGRHVKSHPRRPELHLIGLDYSAGMIAESAKTKAYDALVQRDITKPFEMPGGPVDVLIASAVFYANHVGPAAIRNITAHLRPGGLFIISVRELTYDEHTEEYDRHFADANCTMVMKRLSTYWPAANVKAYYFMLRKNAE